MSSEQIEKAKQFMADLGYEFYEGHDGVFIPPSDKGMRGWFCISLEQIVQIIESKHEL